MGEKRRPYSGDWAWGDDWEWEPKLARNPPNDLWDDDAWMNADKYLSAFGREDPPPDDGPKGGGGGRKRPPEVQQLTLMDDGSWLIPSRSEPGKVRRITPEGKCNCPGYRVRKHCFHADLVAARLAAGADQRGLPFGDESAA